MYVPIVNVSAIVNVRAHSMMYRAHSKCRGTTDSTRTPPPIHFFSNRKTLTSRKVSGVSRKTQRRWLQLAKNYRLTLRNPMIWGYWRRSTRPRLGISKREKVDDSRPGALYKRECTGSSVWRGCTRVCTEASVRC